MKSATGQKVTWNKRSKSSNMIIAGSRRNESAIIVFLLFAYCIYCWNTIFSKLNNDNVIHLSRKFRTFADNLSNEEKEYDRQRQRYVAIRNTVWLPTSYKDLRPTHNRRTLRTLACPFGSVCGGTGLCISRLGRQWPNGHIEIEAQLTKQKFYERLGFVATSEPFMMEGLMHIEMRLDF